MEVKIEELLDRDGGASVYEALGYNVPYNKKRTVCHSPFGGKTGDEFNIFLYKGKYCWKCHSSGEGGNVWKLIEATFPTHTPRQIAEVIKECYGHSATRNIPKPTVRRKPPKKTPVGEYLTSIDLRPLTEDEYTFIYKKTGASKFIVDRAGVKVIKSYTTTEKTVHKPRGFCYAFEAYPNKLYKIYEPYGKVKKYWTPGVAKVREDLGDPHWQPILGIDTPADTNAPYYLTGGETDMLALQALGYNAITFGGEQITPSESSLQRLQGKAIKQVLDTDWAGLNSACKKEKKFKWEAITLPKFDQQVFRYDKKSGKYIHFNGNKYPHSPKREALSQKPKDNDICDYIAQYGHDFDLRYALDPEAPVATFNKKLGEADLSGIYKRCGEKGAKTILQVPTGSGKTTTALLKDFSRYGAPNKLGMLGYAEKLGKTLVFAAPLTAVVEQAGREHGTQIVCQGYTNAASASATHTVTTFNSLPRLLAHFEEMNELENVWLVIDEIHEMVKAANYQDIPSVAAYFPHVHSITGLSATVTPVQDLFRLQGFKVFNFERLHNPNVTVTPLVIDRTEISDTLLSIAQENKNQSVLYFHDRKDRDTKQNIWEIEAAMLRQGIDAVAIEGGMTVKEKKNHPVYQHIIDNGELPQGKHVVATQVLATGVTANCGRIVFVTKQNSKDLIKFMQAYARSRRNHIDVTLVIVQEGETPRSNRSFNINAISDTRRTYRATIDKLNKQYRHVAKLKSAGHILDAARTVPDTLPAEMRHYIYFDKVAEQFKLNEYRVAQNEYNAVCRDTDTVGFLLQLSENIPNLTLNDLQDTDTTAEDQAAIKEEQRRLKEQLEKDQDALSVALKDPTIGATIAEYVRIDSDSEGVKNACQYYIDDNRGIIDSAWLTSDREELLRRNRDHLRGFFVRYKSIRRNLNECVPLDTTVDIAIERNKTQRGTKMKQLNYLASFAIVSLLHKVPASKDYWIELKKADIEATYKWVREVERLRQQCDTLDRKQLAILLGKAKVTKNDFKMFWDVSSNRDGTITFQSTLFDIEEIIGRDNKKRLIQKFGGGNVKKSL